ncbi:hypothetical protein ACT453_31330 [Bacillus sp. D-CC]
MEQLVEWLVGQVWSIGLVVFALGAGVYFTIAKTTSPILHTCPTNHSTNCSIQIPLIILLKTIL